MRRRAMLWVVAMVGALVVGSGVALAATFTCAANPCLGTPDPDNIQGTNDYNEIYASAGTDFVYALGGSDIVDGGEGNDIVFLLGGSDTAYGAEGNDLVVGSPGQDAIYGGPDGDGSALGTDFNDPDIANLEGGEDSDIVYGGGGNDYIDAAYRDEPSEFPTTEPVDTSYGQGGNDRIYAADGNEDIISCGKGTRDVAIFDKGIDTTTGCEKKTGAVVSPI